MEIYVLGNRLVEHDSLQIRLLPDLMKAFPDIRFIELDPSEDFPDHAELVFLDCATGIDEVKVTDDLGRLADDPKYSLHDFGLATHLKLLKKLQRLERAILICIPFDMGYEYALMQTVSKIREVRSSLS